MPFSHEAAHIHVSFLPLIVVCFIILCENDLKTNDKLLNLLYKRSDFKLLSKIHVGLPFKCTSQCEKKPLYEKSHLCKFKKVKDK